MSKIATRLALGEGLKELGTINDKVVVFDADVGNATHTNIFGNAFPERYFQMGIAEANMICTAAGISDFGYIPFVSTFSIFGVGRAYDQIRNTVAYSKANVKLAMTHCGITGGPDGGSHQAIEDIALMRVIPGMTILCPCDENETKEAVKLAAKIDGPVYLRISRMATETYITAEFVLGGSRVMREGEDVVLFTCGTMVSQSLDATKILAEQGIDAAVVNLYSIKPIDEERVVQYANRCKKVISVEEHSIIGGLGDAVSMVLEKYGISCTFKRIGVRDMFGISATPEKIVAAYGLDGKGIATQIGMERVTCSNE